MNLDFKGTFFGWGAGGAAKMDAFMELFKALGFKHVVAIFDGDKEKDAQKATQKFQDYKIITLKTDDIRDKFEKQIIIESGNSEKKEVLVKEGLADKDRKLKPEYKEYLTSLIHDTNAYLSRR